MEKLVDLVPVKGKAGADEMVTLRDLL